MPRQAVDKGANPVRISQSPESSPRNPLLRSRHQDSHAASTRTSIQGIATSRSRTQSNSEACSLCQAGESLELPDLGLLKVCPRRLDRIAGRRHRLRAHARVGPPRRNRSRTARLMPFWSQPVTPSLLLVSAPEYPSISAAILSNARLLSRRFSKHRKRSPAVAAACRLRVALVARGQVWRNEARRCGR